jgi:excisionase family DNA binding protein
MIEEADTRVTLSVDEAADVLGVSAGLVYDLVRQGRLPAARLGRRIVLSRRKVVALVDPPDNAA